MSTALALVENEVLGPEPTLEELADEVNREHDLCAQHMESALPHAIRAGRALIQASGLVPKGQWETWLIENCRLRLAMARVYIRLATYPEKAASCRSITEARHLLKGLPSVSHRGHTGHEYEGYDDALRERAVALRHDGLSYAEVARRVGVSKPTVWAWVNPQRAALKEKSKAGKRALTEDLLRQRKRDVALKRAVKKAGAATAEAWAMAERFQDVIAQAHDETQDSEARAALARAGEHYRKMRDEIVRALGVQ